MEKSAKGIVGRVAPTEGPNDERRGRWMKSPSEVTDLLRKPAVLQKDAKVGESNVSESIPPQALLEQVLDRKLLLHFLHTRHPWR